MAEKQEDIIQEVTNEEYKWGFVTDIDTDTIGKGLNEDVIRLISRKKEEPEWLLDFRLKALRRWQTMKEPDWAHLEYETPNYQDIIYFAAPKQEKKKSIDDCQHIAAAILSGCDMITSWNFKHIVNVKTIKGIKVITTMEGYKDLLIYPPPVLLESEDYNDEHGE